MKDQERRDMKKIILCLMLSLSILSFDKVLADETINSTISEVSQESTSEVSQETLEDETLNLDFANNLKIKYKWYKLERVDGTYHIRGEELDGYLEDETNITYGNFTGWSNTLCYLSGDSRYDLDSKFVHIYSIPANTRYIRITDYKDIKSLKVYTLTTSIEYDYLKNTKDEILIDLKNEYSTETIWVNIDTDNPFSVSFLYKINPDKYSAYKKISTGGGVLIPDKTWIENNITYQSYSTENKIADTDLKVFIKSYISCRYREIKTYRYKLEKQYYDDDYHEYVEGYIPDTSSYLVEYTGDIPEKTKEVIKVVTKEVKVPEYIKLSDDTTKDKDPIDDTSLGDDTSALEPIIKTQYVENEVVREVYKIPKKIYILIVIFVITIIFELLIIRKKSKEKID